MSEGDELIQIPDENAHPSLLGFGVSVDFHPAIKIARKPGLEFTAELSEIFEPEDVHLEGTQWEIQGGGVCEGIRMEVQKRTLLVEVWRPANRLEWYEQKINALLRTFEQKFEPRSALRFNVMMSGLVGLPEGADARAFLGGHVMLMDPHQLALIDRPLDILGIRLRFPANDSYDWDVNVRVESWGEDPQKIFINADADWDSGELWDGEFVDKSVGRITLISNFISEQVVRFLRKPPFTENESDNGGES